MTSRDRANPPLTSTALAAATATAAAFLCVACAATIDPGGAGGDGGAYADVVVIGDWSGPRSDGGSAPDAPSSADDGGANNGDAAVSPDAAPPPPPPKSLSPCNVGRCWDAPALSNACGAWPLDENYSSGKYNVHRWSLLARANVTYEVTLQRTGGSFAPALLLHDAKGKTVYDGERGVASAALTVTRLASGRGASKASLRLKAAADTQLDVFATGWNVVDNGFSPALSTTAKYTLTVDGKCQPPPTGAVQSPPNFDPSNRDSKGYYLLPQSQPSGLYTRKADGCSRGNKLLIDVIYTVAKRFDQIRPSLTPIAIRDLNEGPCSTVDHATHDDGTHVDVVAGCATRVSCTDNQQAIDLAKLFVDTGEVCGILFNDTAVQSVINAYFASKYSYTPWKSKFMRTVSGHTSHFHVRVKKPNGACN